ncbi:MAG: hypothetical protein RI957_1656 [Verrucomicrobiota bacterium]|jgi:hypothetical protein
MSTSSETTPDQLLASFRGRSFKAIILFTVVAHLVVIGGTSIPYFIKSMSSSADPKLTEQERLDLAAREATSLLRDVASKHGLNPQDLSTHLTGGATPVAPKENAPTAATDAQTDKEKTGAKETTPAVDTEKPATGGAEKTKSALEQEIEVKKAGPSVPPVPTEESTDEDLFR